MNKNMSAIRLGIFIFIGLAILVLAVFLIGRKESLFSSTFTVKAYFSNIEGLRSGAAVRLSGIDVGSVGSTQIVNDTTGRVEVIMKLSKNIAKFIRTNTKATIETEGLVGNKVVVLIMGSSQADRIKDGGVIQSKEPIGFSAIVQQTEGIMLYTKNMTKDLSEIIARINRGEGSIGKLLTNNKLYNNATQLTKQAGESLVAITNELKRITSLFDTLGLGVQHLVTNVNMSAVEIDTVIAGIKLGKGVLGKLLVEESPFDSSLTLTLANVQKTAANARLASSRLAENMEALKHNWLFKGYFENRGYWDKAKYEDEISNRMKELDTKIRILNQRIYQLQIIEKKIESEKK